MNTMTLILSKSRSWMLTEYKRFLRSWSLQASLTAIDETPYADFGVSVSIYEDLIAVGASSDSIVAPLGGAVYLYRLITSSDDDSFVTFSQKLLPQELNPHSYFGYSMLFRPNIGLVRFV